VLQYQPLQMDPLQLCTFSYFFLSTVLISSKYSETVNRFDLQVAVSKDPHVDETPSLTLPYATTGSSA
ncbi:MAG: hypothetical protein J6T13_11360, partial [Bacteroidales bacterium]|nr:hypothetical protein [Bacteroidales bacterium]